MALNIDSIKCPFCGKEAVDTFDADLPDVMSDGVYGGLQWECPSCGRSGMLGYRAVYVCATLFDDCGDEIGEVD